MNTITANQVRTAVRDLRRTGLGCCHFRLWTDWDHPKERTYYAVIGWSGTGCDPDDAEDYYIDAANGGDICMKIAYQDRDNAMQCDMDLDFEMPYDPETGDVFDTYYSVPRCKSILPWNVRRHWEAVAASLNEDALAVREHVEAQTAERIASRLAKHYGDRMAAAKQEEAA